MDINKKLPLCVDLDGTLIKSDLLVESFFLLLKKNLFYVFLAIFWLRKGKACLKREIAHRVDLDCGDIPLTEDFVCFLKKQHAEGRQLILVTASDEKYANQIASQLGFFDQVIASDGITNLSGRKKRDQLDRLFGSGGYEYAGNAKVDISVWDASGGAIVVNPEPAVKQYMASSKKVTHVFGDQDVGHWLHYIKAIRVYQWVKNLLVFAPLMLAHEFSSIVPFGQAFFAFLSFSFCASAIYLLNDLGDLDTDRAHPRKCKRPFAAGKIPLIHGVYLLPVLLGLSVLCAALLPAMFSLVLLVYLLSTVLYSFVLKKLVLVDVLVLAGLYTLRIVGGAAAVGVALSFWVLALSMFIFLSLALVKRYAELYDNREGIGQTNKGRGYRVQDIDLLHSMGISSGYMAVLVVALYVNSPQVVVMYSSPHLLWLTCPLLLFWVSRMWIKASRGDMHDDPLVFAVKDRVSQFMVVVVFTIVLIAF